MAKILVFVGVIAVAPPTQTIFLRQCLYIMLCAVVVSIVLHGTILYHKNYYGQVSFLVTLSAVLSEERGVRNKLTAKLDMSFRE